ncbi:sensor histidine kinase [Paenibacillus agaridevorans]|uniref:sensor histidine kinase n=1 Tax=Paenibacillus agaridevorans TaxID=171404 RepID=UPI001BE4C980|nr:histidine kinase [Paenibacillus agaridevorans]
MTEKDAAYVSLSLQDEMYVCFPGGYRIKANSVDTIKKRMKLLFFGLRNKFILFNTVIGIVFITVLSALLSHFMEKYAKENINQYVTSLNAQISNSIDRYVDDMQKVLMILSEDANLPVIADKKFVGTFEGYTAYNRFYDNIRSLIFFKGYKSLSVILFDRQEILTTDLNDGEDFKYIRNALNTNMYREITDSEQSMVLLPGFSLLPGKDNNTLFSQAIKLWGNLPGEKDFMVLSADKDLFSQFLNGVNNQAFDDILITTEDGKVIFSLNSDVSAYDEFSDKDIGRLAEFDTLRLHGASYYANVKNSATTGWYVVSLINQNKIDKQINDSKIIIMLTGIIVMAILVLAVHLFVTRSTRDLKRLSKTMKNIEKSNYQIRSDINRNDEIGDLSRSFNAMIKNVLENQVLRNEAEIKSLQDQINPHFLYNTLDAISSLAIKRDHVRINGMVEKLADFYRYNMNIASNNVVEIGTEIQHVKNYLEIIQVRYGSRLSVNYEIDEGMSEYRTIRFTLQPVVENAIKHAFNEMSMACVIEIKAYETEDTIVLEVTDNGIGIEESKLRKIMQDIEGETFLFHSEARGGVGLKNANMRYKLLFGGDYGISIESAKGSGTKVVITGRKMK